MNTKLADKLLAEKKDDFSGESTHGYFYNQAIEDSAEKAEVCIKKVINVKAIEKIVSNFHPIVLSDYKDKDMATAIVNYLLTELGVEQK